MTHWHISSGLLGYGPMGDETETVAATLEEVADCIQYELDAWIDSQYESANALAEMGEFEDAWNTLKRSEHLSAIRANFDNKRADAPLYAGKPQLWRDTIRRQIGELFPLDVSDNSRLYVWDCDDTTCGEE